MIQLLFNSLISILTNLLRLILYPINLLITNTLPDLTIKITETSNTILQFFTNLAWPLSIIPIGILNTLAFILLVEIAKHTIYISTHALIRMWNLFQKIKFW